MLRKYEQLQGQLEDPDLPHHREQILKVSLFMLKDIMNNTARDIRRYLRESGDYS